MAQRYLVETYEVRIPYTIDGLTHRMSLAYRPDASVVGYDVPGTDVTTLKCITGTNTSSFVVFETELFLSLIEGFYDAGTAISSFEVWYYDGVTSDATFITAAQVTFLGTNASPHVDANQTTWTYRTTTGRIKKFVFLETSQIGNAIVPQSDATLGPEAEAFRNNVIKSPTPFIDREGGYPIAALNRATGQNEATWRKRFR